MEEALRAVDGGDAFDRYLFSTESTSIRWSCIRLTTNPTSTVAAVDAATPTRNVRNRHISSVYKFVL